MTTLRKPQVGSIETRSYANITSHRAVWRVNGTKQTKAFDTHDEACDHLDEIAIKMRRGVPAPNLARPRTPFAVAADLWLAQEVNDLSRKSGVIRNHLIPTFKNKPVGDITRMEIQTWVNTMAAELECESCEDLQEALADDKARCRYHREHRTYSAATVHEYYGVLSKMLRTLAIDGYFGAVGAPVGKGLITLPSKNKRMVILEHEQSDHLLEVVAERFPTESAFIHIESHTGLRLGELVALSRRQYTARGLMVDRAFKRSGKVGPTKTHNRRMVGLSDCCRDILDEHLATHDEDLIFPGPVGGLQQPTNWRKRRWYDIRKAAGLDSLDLHFHDLRHTHCSHLLAAGWEVTVVAERMGHSSTKMTLDVYGHPMADRQASLLSQKGMRASA